MFISPPIQQRKPKSKFNSGPLAHYPKRLLLPSCPHIGILDDCLHRKADLDMSQPPHPIANCHVALPDLFLTAISLLFLLSPSSSKLHKHPFFSFPFCPRRFRKIPTMSLTGNRFNSPQSLSDWLKPRLPSDSFASWGLKPGTKNVHNLWLELADGETSLADSTPPVRTVEVVTVRILRDDNQILVETRQELSDGSVRDRNRPLSEKMKPGETPETAVIRAIKEELGSIISGSNCDIGSVVTIAPESYAKRVEERNSVSYPGLPARYVLHSVDAWVEGLPDGEFCTEEEEEYEDCDQTRVADKAVSVKKHYWKWVSSDSLQS